jgi:hypothetical protein
LIVLSILQDAKYFPSTEKATKITASLCPRNVKSSLCKSMLHNLTVLSVLPEARYLPSVENAIELTDF